MEKMYILRDAFGHGLCAFNDAKANNAKIIILPKKDTKKEFEAESRKIYDNLADFFEKKLLIIAPFEERERYEAELRDPIAELKAGEFPTEEWTRFARTRLNPRFMPDLPKFHLSPESLDDRMSELERFDIHNAKDPFYGRSKRPLNILVIPEKLLSDGECGVSADQQSLAPWMFKFVNKYGLAVLGQHFNKVTDLERVKAIADELHMYVPGLTENPEVLGIRGVQHCKYFNLYGQLDASVGIAGTHTWLMLVAFPEVPQIILYNRKGVEDWEAIGAAFRKAGRKIVTIGFDENTDKVALSKEIESAFVELIK